MSTAAFDPLANEPRWVAWRNEPRPPNGKITKIPYGPNGRKARADDPSTWGTREQAALRAKLIVNGFGGGIGFELGDLGADLYLGGADLDSCLDEQRTLAPWAEAILDVVQSYAEVSPSGHGLKAFFYLSAEDVRPFLELCGIADPSQWGFKRSVGGDARDHGTAVELYCNGRYFTITGDRWPSQPDEIRLLDWLALERLAALIPPAHPSKTSSTTAGADNSRSAIAFRKGAALRREGKNFEEMCAALRSDLETAAWVREKGDANNGRELRRIWEKAQACTSTFDPTQKHALGGRPSTPGPRLDIGSDIEIAECVASDLRRDFGEIVFADGDFWRYAGTHWQPIDDPTARRTVHIYDGVIYYSASGKPSTVRLSKSRVDSVLHEMGAMLDRPDFFANAAVGINCASGFIVFDSNGHPRILPHDPDHRCRHVLPGHWPSGVVTEDPPPDSLLGRLLGGVFKGDDDEAEKRELLAEIAAAAALGYATKMRQPKAIVLKGEKAENGKSQVLDLIRGLLPPTAVASVTAAKVGDERFIVSLRSKLLNAADELSGSAAIASDTFKSAVTGEPVSGRDVYRSAITFRPVAQHVFATNTLPTFAGGHGSRCSAPIACDHLQPGDPDR